MAPETNNVTVDTPHLLQTEGIIPSLNLSDLIYIPGYFEFWGGIVMSIITIIVILCGLVGNGTVIWLLSFRMKRNHFSVYILNLAIADFIFLFTFILRVPVSLITHTIYLFEFVDILFMSSYTVGMILLMAISFERCVSVLWPIWYKCHRPAHLSTIVCALIWVIFLLITSIMYIFQRLQIGDIFMLLIFGFISLPTFLVLFVSSLTLFIRVQCYSQQRKPSRVYWTIVLNVLGFLLFGVPNGVSVACTFFMEPTFESPVIMTLKILLSALNSAVNPIIYFFIGRHRQQGRRKSLQKVLQRALMDDDEEAEQRRGRTSSPDRA